MRRRRSSRVHARGREDYRFRALVVISSLLVLAPFAGSAGAGTPQASERLARIVATVAGRPVAVSCESRDRAWRREVRAARIARAVAYFDPATGRIHFGPVICRDVLEARHGMSLASVRALFIAAHEAAHAAGVAGEARANCWALYWVQDLARRFYAVEFFTPASRRVRLYSRQLMRDSPPAYRTLCPVGRAPSRPRGA